LLTFYTALPPLAAAFVVGLAVSFIQARTGSDPTTSTVPKNWFGPDHLDGSQDSGGRRGITHFWRLDGRGDEPVLGGSVAISARDYQVSTG